MRSPIAARFVPLAAACLLLALHASYYWPGAIDDAYISYRYAANLAAGQGLVFNAGERVEGYSDLLWTLLSALAIRLGLDPLRAGKLLGLLSALGMLVVTERLLSPTAARGDPGAGETSPAGPSRSGGNAPSRAPDHPVPTPSRAVPAAGLALLAASAPLAFWSVQGMETTFFGLLLCLAFWRLVVEVESSAFPWSGAFFALACLTRPEGPLYLAAGAACRLLGHGRRRDRRRLKQELLWLGLALLPLAVHLLWRRVYYGQLLPNPYYAKGQAGLSLLSLSAHGEGLSYLVRWLLSAGAAPALLLGGGLLALGLRFRLRRLIALLWVLAGLCFAYQANGDWMPSFRFLVPVLPGLVLLGAGGLEELERLGWRLAERREEGRAPGQPSRSGGWREAKRAGGPLGGREEKGGLSPREAPPAGDPRHAAANGRSPAAAAPGTALPAPAVCPPTPAPVPPRSRSAFLPPLLVAAPALLFAFLDARTDRYQEERVTRKELAPASLWLDRWCGGADSYLLPMAMHLMERLRDGEALVYGDIGVAGYLNPGLTIIDNRGLVDPAMAHYLFYRSGRPQAAEGPRREFLRRLFARRPEAAVVVLGGPAQVPVWQGEVFGGHPLFRQEYVLEDRLTHRRGKVECFYLRRDLAGRRLAPAEVAAHYERAIRLAPRLPGLYLRLARLYEDGGRREEAERLRERAMRRFGRSPAFRARLQEERR